MTESILEKQRSRQDSRSLYAAIALVVVGMDTFIVQPGFVQGLVQNAGFAEQQAGYVASAEMLGIAASTVLMMGLASRLRWRALVSCALLVNIVANLVCLNAATFQSFAALRFIVGLSSGVLISIGYAITGATAKPDRNFGWLIMWVLIYGALGLLVMPATLATFGMAGILIALACMALLGGLALREVPKSGIAGQPGGTSTQLPGLHRLLLLTAVLSYFLGQGALWAYLSLIGVANGGTDQQVAGSLTLAQFLGIAGAFTAATLGARVRHSQSLAVGIVAGAVPLLFLFGGSGALVFAIAVGIFNFAANFITPLLMSVVATCDRSGRLVIYSVGLQMLGLAIGPAVAATVIKPGMYGPLIWLAVLLFAICLAVVLPPVMANQARARG